MYVESNNKLKLSQNSSYEPLLTLIPSHPLLDKEKRKKDTQTKYIIEIEITY